MQPKRRAIAGASTAWSKWVWPTSTPTVSPGALDEAVERRRVGQRRPPQQQVAEGDAREVGVDEQRLALVGQPVAGDPEPLDLQPRRQLQRPRLQLAQRLAVGARLRSAASPAPSPARRGVAAGRPPALAQAAAAIVAESFGGLASVWKTTQ